MHRDLSFSVASRYGLLVAVAAVCCLPVALTGCKRATSGSTIATASPQAIQSAQQQMELIPPPSKTRFMAVRSLSSWENPYMTVQENMVTLHVTLADANESDLGVGGMLRPVGARRQDLDVRVSDLPDALAAVPESSWPYGRVVAIEEAHDAPASARPAIRRDVEAAIKTLTDLGVVVYEWNDGTAELR
jgi:cell division septation protein DedD